jgi:flagellar export protein FliJ
MSKAYKTLMRLQRWQLDEERRRLAALYREQERLVQTSSRLERRRQDEAKVADAEVAHAYPGYAGRVRADQARLAETVAELDEQVAARQDDVATAYLALKQVEIVRNKQRSAAALAAARREQDRLDEVGLDMHRRKGA